MKVKVCGITRLEDATLAAQLGAWAVGFIFHPESPRYIAPKAAARIVAELPAGLEKIGVFVDLSPERVREVRAEVGLTLVQLHGRETPENVHRVGGRILKAIRARSESELVGLSDLEVEAVLLDGPQAGQLADWSLAHAVKRHHALILAGGLSDRNVARAVRETRPMAVDVSSSLESEPGIKDPARLKRFFDEVREL
jgi:phosphoribosylanthranilate isomerase